MCDTFMRLIRRECFSKYICASWWFLLYCLYKANMKEQRYTAKKKVWMVFCVCIFVILWLFWTGNNIFPWFSWYLIGYHTKAVMILGDLFWPFHELINSFWRSTSDNKQGLFGQKKIIVNLTNQVFLSSVRLWHRLGASGHPLVIGQPAAS